HAEVDGDALVAHRADGLVPRRAAAHGDIRPAPECAGDRSGPTAAVVIHPALPAALEVAGVVAGLAAHTQAAVPRVPRVPILTLASRDLRHGTPPSGPVRLPGRRTALALAKPMAVNGARDHEGSSCKPRAEPPRVWDVHTGVEGTSSRTGGIHAGADRLGERRGLAPDLRSPNLPAVAQPSRARRHDVRLILRDGLDREHRPI